LDSKFNHPFFKFKLDSLRALCLNFGLNPDAFELNSISYQVRLVAHLRQSHQFGLISFVYLGHDESLAILILSSEFDRESA